MLRQEAQSYSLIFLLMPPAAKLVPLELKARLLIIVGSRLEKKERRSLKIILGGSATILCCASLWRFSSKIN